MTARDFELIARTLRAADDLLSPTKHAELVEQFATELSAANPRFKRDRFIAAASVPFDTWIVERVLNVSTGESVEVGHVFADDREAAQRRGAELVGDFQTFRVRPVAS